MIANLLDAEIDVNLSYYRKQAAFYADCLAQYEAELHRRLRLAEEEAKRLAEAKRNEIINLPLPRRVVEDRAKGATWWRNEIQNACKAALEEK